VSPLYLQMAQEIASLAKNYDQDFIQVKGLRASHQMYILAASLIATLNTSVTHNLKLKLVTHCIDSLSVLYGGRGNSKCFYIMSKQPLCSHQGYVLTIFVCKYA